MSRALLLHGTLNVPASLSLAGAHSWLLMWELPWARWVCWVCNEVSGMFGESSEKDFKTEQHRAKRKATQR